MATGGMNFPESIGSEDLSEVVCDPCQEDGELHKAVGMCVDCQDYLCERCFDAHQIAKAYRKHELVNMEAMLQSQVVIPKDKCTEKCSVHEDEFIKYYCVNHCQLGCSVCITLDHRLCDNVRYIPHVGQNLANIEEYKQAENHLQSVVQRYMDINEEIKRKSATFDKNCSDAVKEIQEFRKQIHNALDKIESDIIKKCETLKSKEKEKMEQIVNKFKTTQKELDSLMAMTKQFKNNNQKCNLYTVMMKTKDQVKIAEEKIKKAEKEQTNINSRIKFVVNNETMDTIKHSKALGQLEITGLADTLIPEETARRQMKPTTITEAKMTRPDVRAEYIQDINVKASDDKRTCNITGLVVLPDNRLVITDFFPQMFAFSGNENIKLVDVQHKVITHLALSSTPFDVAMVTKSLIAVTLPYGNKIALVNVTATAMTVDRELVVHGECYGVDYKEGRLAVAFCTPDKVQVLTLLGIVIHTITNTDIQQTFVYYPYVVFGHDNTSLYVSSPSNNKIVHVKFKGTTVDIYKQRDLNRPSGLVTDSSGNIFVCGSSTHNIHHVTPSSKKIQVLLTKTDGLASPPRAISYNERDCKLYVGMCNNDVIKIYSVIIGSN